MGKSTPPKRLRYDDDHPLDPNGQSTTSYSSQQSSDMPSNTTLPSLDHNNTPVYNNYQPVPTNTPNFEAITHRKDTWPAMFMEHIPLLGPSLPVSANSFWSSQGFYGSNIGAVDYQHNFFPNVCSAGLPQTNSTQTPPVYPQSLGYEFITDNPQLPVSGDIDPLVEIQTFQADHSQQGILGFLQTQNVTNAFVTPPVRQTYLQTEIGQSFLKEETSTPYFFGLDFLNEYNAFSTLAFAQIQQPSQNKGSTSTNLDSILEEQPAVACEFIEPTDNDPVPTQTPDFEGADARKKKDKLFDQYFGQFVETGHLVQHQPYDYEQEKGIDKPAKYSSAEKELAVGQNSKYEWERNIANAKREIEQRQVLGLPGHKNEAQIKREKNAEQRRKLKKTKRARENAQNSSATLVAPTMIPALATTADIQTAPAQIASTQIAPALTKEALKALGPLTPAQSKQLWHPVEHAYMWWEPNREDYHALIIPSGLDNPMYKCAHEEPKCEVEPITCTHPCCKTGVSWKTKKDLLIKAIRKSGDKEADKRGFPRPIYTRRAKESEAPSTQVSAAPAPVQVSTQLTSWVVADSVRAPGPIPDSNPKPIALSSGQHVPLHATNPILFTPLQAQPKPHPQAAENPSHESQREEDDSSAARQPKRTSRGTVRDRTLQPATVLPTPRPSSISGWANQDRQAAPATEGLPKKLISVSESSKNSGGSGWSSQDRQPEPAPAVLSPVTTNNLGTQRTINALVGTKGPLNKTDDEETDSLFEDDGLDSLFDDDGLGSLFGDDDDVGT